MFTVENVSKRYGKLTVLQPVSLSFAETTTTILIGPSGCGKSTLLRLLLGLIAPDTGSVQFEGNVVTSGSIEQIRREVGYMTQDGGLFPHLTAAQNVTLVPDYIGKPRASTTQRLRELAELVQLPSTLFDRFPSDLSGGQKQRLSLMRALILDPKVLLLDEPLGALDPITRRELQTQLKDIFKRLKKSVILVTHDMGEAAYFGDHIVLMRSGHVVQQGQLADLVERPADPYVTEFINAQRALEPQSRTAP